MPSPAEQIAQRVATILVANGAAAIYRDRADAIAREEGLVTLVECIDEDTETLGGPAHLAAAQTHSDALRLAVTQCARAAAWQTVADAARVASHALIVADPQLRQWCAQIARDRCEWRPASADLPFGYCAQIYRFVFHTRGQALDSLL